ncbi:MAG: uroporphyrinogen decarboxylase family protein [Andreesenia angusta]|nr:uroporphyrinogen decarboxylase family protein [Andreesenia angusta]
MKIYKCSASNEPSIKKRLIENGALFPNVFFNEDELLNIILKTFPDPDNSIITLPLCNTLIAEVFDADIDYGDKIMDPYIKSYRYNNLYDIPKKIDSLYTDRILTALNITRKLSDKGYIVSFNIDGPFTILGSLIDPIKLFKSFKKNPKLLKSIIDFLSSVIIEFGNKVIESNASIISYSDSSGTIDLIGPRLFNEFCTEPNLKIIKSFRSQIENKKSIIHICGKSTYGLYSTDKIEIIPHMTKESKYRDALLKIIDENKIKIIGNSCLGKINLKPFNSEIFEIIIKDSK